MTQTIEQPKTSSIAKRSYDPLSPIGSAVGLKSLLENQREGIAQALPRHVTPERLIKTLLVAANRTPDLLQCTQASILETINRAAELGLDLSGTLGEAYPVPFNNKVRDSNGGERWVKQCQLIIGYRGFAKLARQTGEIKRIEADVVCVNDTFVFRKGSDARCEFTPCLKGPRGEVVGAYAYVQFKDGGEQFDFMPADDIEKVRRRSKSGSDKNGNAMGAWKTDWLEMAKKTIFRRVAKWLPLSTEKFVAALEHEETELNDVVSAATGPRSRSDDFDRKLAGQIPGPSEGQVIDTTTGQLDEVPADDVPVIDAPSSNQADDSAVGDLIDNRVIVPNDASETWLIELAVDKSPVGITPDEAEKRVRAHLKTKLLKPWAKMATDARQDLVDAIASGQFWK